MPSEHPQLSNVSLIVPSVMSQDPEEEELAPALSSSHTSEHTVQGHGEELSQTKDSGEGQLCLPLHSACVCPGSHQQIL